jgi:TPR repeat protein
VTLAKSEPSEPLPPLAPSPPAEEPAPRAEPAQPSSAFADGRAALKTRNFAAAAAAFEVACEQEDQPYACVELARLLDLGRGVREDPDRAKGLLMRACAAEVLSACDQLGH